jgi:hypothetical protein
MSCTISCDKFCNDPLYTVGYTVCALVAAGIIAVAILAILGKMGHDPSTPSSLILGGVVAIGVIHVLNSADKKAAALASTLLILAAAACLIPGIFSAYNLTILGAVTLGLVAVAALSSSALYIRC